jgi:hypothetical protein
MRAVDLGTTKLKQRLFSGKQIPLGVEHFDIADDAFTVPLLRECGDLTLREAIRQTFGDWAPDENGERIVGLRARQLQTGELGFGLRQQRFQSD